MVKPSAGLLEDRNVAILTLTSFTRRQCDDGGIRLVSPSKRVHAGAQVANVRHNLEAAAIPADLPDTWVVVDALPRSRDGDVDRRALRTWVQNVNEPLMREFETLDTLRTLRQPADDMERTLQRLISRELHIPPAQIGMNLSFAEHGGDQSQAMAVAAACEHVSIYLDPDEILNCDTLATLASLASQRGGLAHKRPDEDPREFELSAMQALYFQSPMGGGDLRAARAGKNDTYRFNQSLLLKINETYERLDDVVAAANTVVGHHPMLRARFVRNTERWTQRIAPMSPDAFGFNECSVSAEEDLEAVIEQTQVTLDIENGPVFAAVYVKADDGTRMMYLTAHRLVIDLISYRVIVQDLDELLTNGCLRSQRSMPYPKWIEHQRDRGSAH